MTFSEPVDPASVNETTLRVLEGGYYGAAVEGTRALDAMGRVALFVPSRPWSVGTTYSVYVYGVEDLSGNPTSTSWSFRTGFSADVTAPVVEGVDPPDGTIGVARERPRHAGPERSDRPLERHYRHGPGPGRGRAPSKADSPSTRARRITWFAHQRAGPERAYRVRVLGVSDVAGNVQGHAFEALFKPDPQ